MTQGVFRSGLQASGSGYCVMSERVGDRQQRGDFVPSGCIDLGEVIEKVGKWGPIDNAAGIRASVLPDGRGGVWGPQAERYSGWERDSLLRFGEQGRPQKTSDCVNGIVGLFRGQVSLDEEGISVLCDALRFSSRGQMFCFDLAAFKKISRNELIDKLITYLQSIDAKDGGRCVGMFADVQCNATGTVKKRVSSSCVLMLINPERGNCVVVLPYAIHDYPLPEDWLVSMGLGVEPYSSMLDLIRDVIKSCGGDPKTFSPADYVFLDLPVPQDKSQVSAAKAVRDFEFAILMGNAVTAPTMLACCRDLDDTSCRGRSTTGSRAVSLPFHDHDGGRDSTCSDQVALAVYRNHNAELRSQAETQIDAFAKLLGLEEEVKGTDRFARVGRLLMETDAKIEEDEFLLEKRTCKKIVQSKLSFAATQVKQVVEREMDKVKFSETQLDVNLQAKMGEWRGRRQGRQSRLCCGVISAGVHFEKDEERWSSRQESMSTEIGIVLASCHNQILSTLDQDELDLKARIQDLKERKLRLELLKKNMQISQSCTETMRMPPSRWDRGQVFNGVILAAHLAVSSLRAFSPPLLVGSQSSSAPPTPTPACIRSGALCV